MPIGIISTSMRLPAYVLEDVFSDLEPIIISLQNLAREPNSLYPDWTNA